MVEALRAGGGSGCRDTAPAPFYGIDLGSERRRVGLWPVSSFGGPDPLRARCPGPTLADVLGERMGATGALAPSDLLRRTVTLRLTGGGGFAGRGYGGRHATTIVVELQRTRLIVRGGRR
jgi:hypothetical protein